MAPEHLGFRPCHQIDRDSAQQQGRNQDDQRQFHAPCLLTVSLQCVDADGCSRECKCSGWRPDRAVRQGGGVMVRGRCGGGAGGMPWFVKLEEGLVDKARFDQVVPAHLAWLARLRQQGHRPTSGYWAERVGRSGDGASGMLLFEAAS